MTWAQKHFVYAHNIRYVMLCYDLKCQETQDTRLSIWREHSP